VSQNKFRLIGPSFLQPPFFGPLDFRRSFGFAVPNNDRKLADGAKKGPRFPKKTGPWKISQNFSERSDLARNRSAANNRISRQLSPDSLSE
jgi:hypothetical protein